MKTIKSGKIPDISSNVSDKQIIVYTYACIESAIIEQYHYGKILMIIIPVILGIKTMMVLINSYKNGGCKKYFI